MELQIIVDTFPGTSYAQQAQNQIDALGEGK